MLLYFGGVVLLCFFGVTIHELYCSHTVSRQKTICLQYTFSLLDDPTLQTPIYAIAYNNVVLIHLASPFLSLAV